VLCATWLLQFWTIIINELENELEARQEDELPCESLRADFDEVCIAFRAALLNLGFDEQAVRIATLDVCRISIVVDGYEQQDCILGDWLDENGGRYAHMVRYADGNLFAEHDVLQAHPKNAALFVEAIEIWGKAGRLKSEPRLLAAL